MARRTCRWTCNLALAAVLLCASSAAFSAVQVPGQSATFRWTPASGPVVGYAVYISHNGGAYTLYSRVGSNQASIWSNAGDTIRVRVAALGSSGAVGPSSAPSTVVALQGPVSGSSASGSSAASGPTGWVVLLQAANPVGGGLIDGPWQQAVQSGWTMAAAGDLDGNHSADLLWVDSQNRVWVWLMDGFDAVGGGLLDEQPAPGWKLVGTGDFNGDHHADLIWRNQTTGQVWIWFMNKLDIVSEAWMASPGASDWVLAGAGDFNGDGFADLLWRNPSTGEDWVWLLQNLKLVGGGLAPPLTDPAKKLVGVADFNGDGFADLLWRNSATGKSLVWNLQKFTPLGNQPVRDAGSGWRMAAIADFNGDGFADILWAPAH